MSTSSLAYPRASAVQLAVAADLTTSPASTLAPSPALAAYDALAPHYDDFTAGYQHERWLEVIESLALEHGLCGRRLLDVACGTGKSFAPMLTRGYDTTACDISPEMVAIARERADGGASVFVADMRELPDVGRFDLVTCLDDAINYIVDPADLGRAFASVGARLADGGLFVFDVNTLRTYRETFCQDFDCVAAGRRFRWHAVSA
jgi:SAM-dependent methyltransferase